MNPTRRHVLAGVLAALAASAATGCSSTTAAPPSAGRALTIGLTYIPNVQFSPFYVALDRGLFAAQGLEVTLRHHGEQEDGFGALLAGQEDVVFASGDEAVVAAATGQQVATFATGFQQFPGVLLAASDSGITSVEHLRGRTIGLPGHYGSSYYAVLAALHRAGLGQDDVTLQDIGYTQVSALATGAVDVVVGYRNNETVQFATAGVDVVEIAVVDQEAPTLVGPGLVTIPDSLEESVLTGLTVALLEAERLIIEDADLAIVATRAQVPTLSDPEQEATARAVLAATTRLWLRDGEPSLEVDPRAFAAMVAFLTEVGIIDAPPQVAPVIG